MAGLILGLHDERRRKRQRSILTGALVSLLILWTCKLAFPQQAAATIRSSGHAIEHTLEQSVIALYNKTLPVEIPIVPEPPRMPSADYESLYNGTIIDKVAVIIEDRPKPNLVPLVLHFSTVLGPTWPIIIYTSAETTAHFSTSQALLRLIHTGIVQIRQLPSTILFEKSDSVSSFLTQSWLWEELEPAKFVLLFQTDSVLCSKAARSVEDFFDYDFVGAPISTSMWADGGYNGGLSLRKRESFLRVTKEFDWIENTNQQLRYEDRWFYDKYVDYLIYGVCAAHTLSGSR